MMLAIFAELLNLPRIFFFTMLWLKKYGTSLGSIFLINSLIMMLFLVSLMVLNMIEIYFGLSYHARYFGLFGPLNEEKFQGKGRMLIESLRRLIIYNIEMQVTIVMRLVNKKLKRFILKMTQLESTFQSSLIGTCGPNSKIEISPFVNALEAFMKEINEAKRVERYYQAQQVAIVGVVHWNMSIIWMEGPLGQKTWIED